MTSAPRDVPHGPAPPPVLRELCGDTSRLSEGMRVRLGGRRGGEQETPSSQPPAATTAPTAHSPGRWHDNCPAAWQTGGSRPTPSPQDFPGILRHAGHGLCSYKGSRARSQDTEGRGDCAPLPLAQHTGKHQSPTNSPWRERGGDVWSEFARLQRHPLAENWKDSGVAGKEGPASRLPLRFSEL